MREFFGNYGAGEGIENFGALRSARPYVLRRSGTHQFPACFDALSEAASAKKPDEDVLQFANGGWHKCLV